MIAEAKKVWVFGFNFLSPLPPPKKTTTKRKVCVRGIDEACYFFLQNSNFTALKDENGTKCKSSLLDLKPFDYNSC